MEERTVHEIEKTPDFAGYGGFVERLVAFLIDALLLSLVYGVWTYALARLVGEAGEDFDVGNAGLLMDLVVSCFYFAVMESSPLQGTVGKLLIRIRVADVNGKRIPFWRGVVRHFAKCLSAFAFGLGFLVIIVDEQKRGFHDRIAGTLVLRTRKAGIDGWIEDAGNE